MFGKTVFFFISKQSEDDIYMARQVIPALNQWHSNTGPPGGIT